MNPEQMHINLGDADHTPEDDAAFGDHARARSQISLGTGIYIELPQQHCIIRRAGLPPITLFTVEKIILTRRNRGRKAHQLEHFYRLAGSKVGGFFIAKVLFRYFLLSVGGRKTAHSRRKNRTESMTFHS